MGQLLPKLIVLNGDFGTYKPLADCRYHPHDVITGGETLRFGLSIANIGQGPFELVLENVREEEKGKPVASAKQKIYNDDNSFETIPVDDLFRELHGGHEAWHYRDLATFGVFNEQDQMVSEGDKDGYCVVDIFRLPNSELEKRAIVNSPSDQKYTFDLSCVPMQQKSPIGISVGWADLYGGRITDQYVDISKIQSGIYSLQVIINKGKFNFIESSESKQGIKFRINKEEQDIHKKFEILGNLY